MSGREDGYTIIEALCAFAILSVVLVALYGAGGTSLRLLTVTQDADRAALLAQSKLDQLATIRAPLPDSEAGQFEGTNINWRLETQDVARSDPGPQQLRLQSLRLTLTWPALVGTNELSVSARHVGSEQK